MCVSHDSIKMKIKRLIEQVCYMCVSVVSGGSCVKLVPAGGEEKCISGIDLCCSWPYQHVTHCYKRSI